MVAMYNGQPVIVPDDYLVHHGVLGMKWGVRRYQNPDGTLTRTGRQIRQNAIRYSTRDSSGNKLSSDDKKFLKTDGREKAALAIEDSKQNLIGLTAAQTFAERHPRSLDRKEQRQDLSEFRSYLHKQYTETLNRRLADVKTPSGKVVRFIDSHRDQDLRKRLIDTLEKGKDSKLRLQAD